MSLTAKQKVFIQEYLQDLNATQAAIRAGYSPKTAKEIGAENLTKPHVAAAIKKAVDERAEKLEISAEQVVTDLAKVAFAKMDDYCTWGPDGVRLHPSQALPGGASVAVIKVKERRVVTGGENPTETVTTEFQLCDKLRALELLGKHIGMFKDGPPVVQVSLAEVLDMLDGNKSSVAA